MELLQLMHIAPLPIENTPTKQMMPKMVVLLLLQAQILILISLLLPKINQWLMLPLKTTSAVINNLLILLSMM